MYIQPRLGFGGEKFRILKFRTMHDRQQFRDEVHREYVAQLAGGDQVLKKPDIKSELIPGGSLIRKMSIDELPQLWNVVKGEMSLVGPRPDLLQLEDYTPEQLRRFEVLPGITGLWQVNNKNETTFNEMIQLDIEYVDTATLLLDLRIFDGNGLSNAQAFQLLILIFTLLLLLELHEGFYDMTKIGIIGVGYWGPNLVRNFDNISDCEIVSICDLDPANIKNITGRYPYVKSYSDVDEMFANEDLDGVVIATPTATHYGLAKKALELGLNVFVEKPLTVTSEESQDLIRIANAKGLVIFVGHIFLHSAPVMKLRELIVSGELGEISYISARRLNLGPVRNDVSALYDLATHDISIILHLLGQQPSTVCCQGVDRIKPDIHDVVNLTMKFPNNKMGIVHCSWLDREKSESLQSSATKKWRFTTI